MTSQQGSVALDAIWPGMSVLDREGRVIGSVKFVRAGDPDLEGLADRAPVDDDLDAAFARALAEVEPEAGAAFAEQLIRQGFLKVTGRGPMDHDRYVCADQIAGTDDDTVQLAAPAGDLVVERENWT